MDQLRKLYASLSVGQRIGIIAAVILSVAGITSFVHWRRESDFRPLFTGMVAEDASAIVQKLKESGVDHRITDNGASVLVPAAKVDELRLEMAGAGLPRTGRIGFELFDKTNLGITDFTEHVNYRRALEGELERSIRSLNVVEQSRVHISSPRESVFLDAREPAKASVLLNLRPGARLSDPNILAITNLVASAVEGLSPESVSVVDMRGNLLNRPKRASSEQSDASDSTLEYKHQIEKDLTAKIDSTLTPLLGQDHFRVGISADCDFSTSEQTDESFDPTRSVMTNSQKSEDLAGNSQSNGVPGTPSNLPRPTSRPAGSGSNVSRKTENVAYETSRTVRQVKTPRGSIKRLSASILLDQDVRWEGTGKRARRIVSPPSPEKLKSIRNIVAGIIALTPARGDQLIVESLPFELNTDAEPLSPPSGAPATETNPLRKLMSDPKMLMGAAAAVLLLIVLAFFILKRGKTKLPAAVPVAANLPLNAPPEKASVESSIESSDKAQLTEQTQKTLASTEMSTRIETLRATIRETVNRDPSLAAGVIRGWVAEEPS